MSEAKVQLTCERVCVPEGWDDSSLGENDAGCAGDVCVCSHLGHPGFTVSSHDKETIDFTGF